MPEYTVFLQEPGAAETESVGREAQQLHLLMENAVRVPEGFVVTADALVDFLRDSGAGEKIAHLLTDPDVDERGLEILSRHAVETIIGAEMSWDLESEIIGAYEHLARQQDIGSPRVTVAASVAFHPELFPYFANTFERRATSYDRHDLGRAVREAWASLYTMDSLRYFRAMGWDLRDVRASVLVQRATAPEASGVAVVVPDDEGGHDLVVKGVLGSALALERGEAEPETCLVDLEKGSVVERDLRVQDEFHYPDGTGRMRPRLLPSDLSDQPKVPDEVCAELARLSRLAMKVFGKPMVLEWALEDDALWIIDAIPLEAVEHMSGDEGEEAPVEPEAAPEPGPEPAPGPEAGPGPEAPPAVIEAAPSAPEREEDEEVLEVLRDLGFAPQRKGPAAPPRKVEVSKDEAPPILELEREGPPEEPSEVREDTPSKTLEPEAETPPERSEEDEGAAVEGVGEGMEGPGPEDVGPEREEEAQGPEAEVPVAEGTEEVEDEPELEPGDEAPLSESAAAHRAGGIELLSPEELDTAPYLPVTEMQVLVSTNDPEALRGLPGVPVTGVRFDDGAYLLESVGQKHPLQALVEDEDGVIEALRSGQVAIAQAAFPQPVYVQLTDLRTDVFGALEGGGELEEDEAVPSMGFRGAAKLISKRGEPLLRAEARAIRRARRDNSMTNLHLEIPFPRTVDEVETLYNVLFEEGVRRAGNLRVYIDVAVPSTLLFLHLYSQVSDGFFVRLDELLPALLSVDPSSRGLAGTRYLSAHEKAVRQAILLVTEAARQAKKEVIIETKEQLDAELVEFLLRIGINGICLGVEGLRENVALISQVEQDLQGEVES